MKFKALYMFLDPEGVQWESQMYVKLNYLFERNKKIVMLAVMSYSTHV